jgi:hypothetical protein
VQGGGGTIRAKEGDGFVIFTYFRGPQSEMFELTRVDVPCALCGLVGRCFALDSTHCPELHPRPRGMDRRGGKYGCFDCLRVGRFEFWHDTEVGFLSEDGLEPSRSHSQPVTSALPEAAIVELRRTPQYKSCQQELWLVHCNDFMGYEGAWEPTDFHRNAADGDGRALFMQMAPDYADMWDGAVEKVPGENTPTGWGDAGCYAFQCLHCSERRAHCDWY